eukprot:1036763-Pelagomonas_calceolata.AAC.7
MLGWACLDGQRGDLLPIHMCNGAAGQQVIFRVLSHDPHAIGSHLGVYLPSLLEFLQRPTSFPFQHTIAHAASYPNVSLIAALFFKWKALFQIHQ